ncbi:MAG: glycosyltransferase [Actinomycetota bacterium]|nr:glycosyltransferase [Actinomycetota bacterium]
MSSATLQVQLESELPREVAVGAGTALFICGWCFCPAGRIRSLSFLLDGQPQPVAAYGMPRLDPFRALHPDLDPYATSGLSTDPSSAADPLLLSYRSGFWGTVRLAGDAGEGGGEFRLSLRAELEGGGEAGAELGPIPRRAHVAPVSARWPPGAAGPPVAIAMATYEPPLDLLERQLDSIRAQSHPNWICIVSDDCSSSERYAALGEAIGDDPRFVLSRSPRRLGFYGNFERALELVPAEARYVAMADQDDIWHPDKLEVLLAEIGDAQLVYSDARVVSGDGELISETWWSTRRNNHSDLLSLLVANAVTGAASLFPRELLDYGLPFPPAQFAHFHDHWIGLTALALGEIAFVDRPLYDYVQHGTASLGHAAANQMTSLADRLRHQRAPAERVRMWRLHYFVDVCRLTQFATVLKLRCAERLTPAKRRALDRFLEADQSVLPLIALGLRGARELVGRTPETLGAEWMLFSAFAWRRLLGRSARERPQSRLRLDARPPPSLVMAPGRTGLPEATRTVADKIAPLRWAVSDAAPPRVNLLIPAIDLQHFFGGYIAKFNLARRLAERGVRVRIVTVDPVGQLPGDWTARVESFSGLERLFDSVEIVLGREATAIEVSRHDSFIATTWWTAHIARRAVQSLGGERFLYLIQEYEPFTFPMGSYAALAGQSYAFPHFALFSSELLRDYFRVHELGVFAAGAAAGDRHSAAFQNAITEVAPPTVEDLKGRRTRRLLFYARPEPHAARNMFELGVLALSRALEQGGFRSGWELHGIGTVERGTRIALGGGAALHLLPRSDQRSYAGLLREHDVGLALMYTPHPSLVPIEMASGGMLTVTNSFENKTPAAMAAISANLITAAPTVEGVAAALLQAEAGAADATRRVRGSDVRWSRNWDQSFDEELLEQLAAALGHAGVAPR